MLSRVSATQSHVYTYDALNRMTSVTATRDGEPARTTRYEYDEVGKRTAMLHDDGSRTDYAHDVRDRLTALEKKAAGGATQFGVAYTLDKSGLRTRAVERDESGVLRDVGYEYDALKRLARESVVARNANLGRVTTWTYDKVGNRLSQTVTPASGAPVTTSYVYDANDRLVSETTAGAETRYTYDANGNTRSKATPSGTTSYTFDAENRLVEATTPTATLRYVYNADGIRTKRIETSASGTVASEYLVDPTFAHAQVLEEWQREDGGAPTLAATYAYGAERLSQTRNSVTSFFHADGLGSTRLMTDVSGGVTDRYVYTAFGELDEDASSTTTPNDFLFAGEQLDGSLGLYYNRARYMSPGTGRFLSMDTFLGNPDDPITLNKFAYANAAPTHFVDPSGYFGLAEIGAGMSVLGTLASVALPPKAGEWGNMSDMRKYLHHVALFSKNPNLDDGRSVRVVELGGHTQVFIDVKMRVGAYDPAQPAWAAKLADFGPQAGAVWTVGGLPSRSRRWSVRTQVRQASWWESLWADNVLTVSQGSKSRDCDDENGHARPDLMTVSLCAAADGSTAAHEFGHILGFGHAYRSFFTDAGQVVDPAGDDIMGLRGFGNRRVHWYHIAVLATAYGQ